MTTLTIASLDPFDESAMAAWHATYNAAASYQRSYAAPRALEEMRTQLQMENPGERLLGFTGVSGDRVVVTGTLSLSLKDNLEQAWLEVHTLPELRRNGHGSAMLSHLTAEAQAHGRCLLVTEVAYPYDARVDGSGHPDVEFLRNRGFELGIADVQRVLDLPADEALLEHLIAAAEPMHRDYEFRQFRGRVPEDIVETYGELVGSLLTESPMGDMEFEVQVMDRERIRAEEKISEASGRTKYTTVALADDGTAAAYTELVVARHTPEWAFQWGTLVRPDHRGHRLGVALKARNLLWLQRECSRPRLVRTYNAEVNTHMVAVNERMGFRPVERLGEFQRRVEPGW
ncbi:MAG: hypothetical protein AVDCRST_MAG72-613 [uncultured Nocardioidaceae bacterium]|uniref:N-acetyltransferase domain-containing protein n=1 Tax=uncultured Nocardioidaceae bacterium TaxID=253824 RepID=A0A6J4LP56_9ACTN|nr:MAG: hypothetical protein AVDCRST_MAG72-613 [uncultured Nocardioidaceae bacterium]